MANYRKKANKSARSHCHMCKYWKDGGYGRKSKEFEKSSDHRRRANLDDDISTERGEEDD